MAEALRLFFLAFYAIGVLVLVLRVLPLAFRSAPAERRWWPEGHTRIRLRATAAWGLRAR